MFLFMIPRVELEGSEAKYSTVTRIFDFQSIWHLLPTN